MRAFIIEERGIVSRYTRDRVRFFPNQNKIAAWYHVSETPAKTLAKRRYVKLSATRWPRPRVASFVVADSAQALWGSTVILIMV